MTEPLSNWQSQKDTLSPKEKLATSFLRALQLALARGKGAAIINMAECPIPHADAQEIVVGNKFFPVTVQEILANNPQLPKEVTRLAVFGYSNQLTFQEEEKVQNYIRGNYNMKTASIGSFQVLVFSNSLPKETIFRDAKLPWFNGPFGKDAVWSFDDREGTMKVILHTLQNYSLLDPGSWGIKQEYKV